MTDDSESYATFFKKNKCVLLWNTISVLTVFTLKASTTVRKDDKQYIYNKAKLQAINNFQYFYANI